MLKWSAYKKRFVSILLAVTMLVPTTGYVFAVQQTSAESGLSSEPKSVEGSFGKTGYLEYAASYQITNTDVADIISELPTEKSENTSVGSNDELSGKRCTVISDSGFAEWSFDIPQDGLYHIYLTYAAASFSSGDIEINAMIDDSVLFKELSGLALKRTYVQNGEIKTNVAGNDIKPEVTEIFQWNEIPLRDVTGYVSSPFVFAFEKGTHTLRLTGVRGEVAIEKIRLSAPEKLPTYQEYITAYKKNGAAAPKTNISFIEGEALTEKSDLSILPTSDRSSPATYPQSATQQKLNTVGGTSWKRIHESITWTFEVKDSGLYQIAPRFRQNILDGIFTSRRLLIDEKVPFQEAASLRFNYDSGWQLEPLGSEEPYLFYLEAGQHTLTLEVVMGDVAEVIGQIQSSLSKLNAIYRKIIMISGTSPDIYRDYNFKALIPEEVQELAHQCKLLQNVVDEIDAQVGVDGSYTSIIKKLIFQLDRMSREPETIAKYLEQFKSNIGSLGTWLLSATEQPLQIDRIYFVPQGEEVPAADKGFFDRMAFGIECFFASFVTDYSSVGQISDAGYKNTLKVWMQTGRDQAEILRQLIDTDFAVQYKTSVKLELVASGTLLQSVLAGLGPDVVLNNPVSEPINYAVRNAAVDLSAFPDFDEIAKRFHPAAIEPYTYKGKTYALPETFTFLMFFYRTDIFEELGFEEPKSWDDIIEMIPDLQRKNLTMAFPKDINGYSLLLYQNGGELYMNEGEKTNLKSNECLNSFVEFTEMFTLYDLPITYDFPNRFRSGEMPCGIQDYTMYNQLTVFAPEIKGLWKFIPIPGKQKSDGTVENISVGTGMNDMILTTSKQQALGWEFLKWWTSADIQSKFAKEMETVLGPAAKQPTANMEALTGMTWSSTEAQSLQKQLEHVKAIPEVPGGYYLSRVLNFAVNRVYNSSGTQNMAENPVEVLSDYVDELNNELKRKREEFGIQ